MLTCYTLKKGFKPYFDAWMDERARKGIESEWLFPDKADPSQPLTIATMNSWANTFSKMTGRHYYWHSLRHKFCGSLSEAGIPDDIIQKIVGWESISMVSTYLDIEAEDEFGKYFADGEIIAQKKAGLEDL